MSIPRKIHQCHTKGFSSLNDEELSAISKLKEKNPGWEYFFYDLEGMVSFIRENYPPRYLDAFNKINPNYGAAMADYFRYLLVNKVGGVYLDVKAFVVFPLDEIINPEDEFVIFSWRDNPRGLYSQHGIHKQIVRGDEFQQWNIISKYDNKYLSEVIESVTRNIESYSIFNHGTGYGGVLRTTGPIPYTNAIDAAYDGTGIRFAGNNELNGIMYRDDVSYPSRNLDFHYSKNNSPIVMLCPIKQKLYTVVFSMLRWVLYQKRKVLSKVKTIN